MTQQLRPKSTQNFCGKPMIIINLFRKYVKSIAVHKVQQRMRAVKKYKFPCYNLSELFPQHRSLQYSSVYLFKIHAQRCVTASSVDPNFLPLNRHFLREAGLVQGETKVAISNKWPTLFGDKFIIAVGKRPSSQIISSPKQNMGKVFNDKGSL